jgi:hypothetical protein
MNDDELKKMMEKDQVVPLSPSNEWSNIRRNIEKKGNVFDFVLFKPTMALCACLMIAYLGFFRNFDSHNSRQDNIDEYLMEDSYLYAESEPYEWMD